MFVYIIHFYVTVWKSPFSPMASVLFKFANFARGQYLSSLKLSNKSHGSTYRCHNPLDSILLKSNHHFSVIYPCETQKFQKQTLKPYVAIERAWRLHNASISLMRGLLTRSPAGLFQLRLTSYCTNRSKWSPSSKVCHTSMLWGGARPHRLWQRWMAWRPFILL